MKRVIFFKDLFTNFSKDIFVAKDLKVIHKLETQRLYLSIMSRVIVHPDDVTSRC